MAKDAKGYKRPAPPHTTHLDSRDGSPKIVKGGAEIHGNPESGHRGGGTANPYLREVRKAPR